jgi:rod shape-determining protein MreD
MSYLPNDHNNASEIVRRMVPAGTVLISTLAMALPFPLAWGVMPNLALLFVIIWASLQPRLMPAWAAFGLGLFADLLFGNPIGVWALIFPVAMVAVRLGEERVEGHSLGVDWAFVSLLLLAGHLLCWQLMEFTGREAALLPLLTQAGVTILAYPVAAVLAGRIQRRLIDVRG